MRYLIPLLFLIIIISGCTQAEQTFFAPEQLTEQKDFLLEQKITVEGLAKIESPICTSIACPEEDPCCNTCGGNLALKGEKEKILILGEYQEKEISCKGDSCNISCYPLEKEKKYQVTGIWKKAGSEYYLELEDFRLIE
ncbi:MAG: hypothetical protein ISS95_01005 [Candidatus Aenigmarchaeota archaeon]|nr:hypothetical protein [Candidatus Aenigmarchaeota archaeon]